MKNIIAKAKTILQIFKSSVKKPRAKFFIIPVLALVFGFVLIQPAYAVLEANAVLNGLAWFFTETVINLAGLFIKLSIFILKFLIEIAGYNGYLDGEAVTVGWVMVRDIVNMFFVLILLIIAFGTILGVEQYEWKKMMVKFVMAAIMVNFSRIICGVFIDFAQVFMTTFVNGVAATAGGNLINMFGLDKILSLNSSVGTTDIRQIPILVAAIFGLFLSTIMAFVLGAYLVMLLIRMVVLWVLIILSPIAFVTSVLPQSQKYSQRWWSEFGNHVMVGPVIIFFVWLSFVTAGAGNIHDHVNDRSVAKMDANALDQDGNVYLNSIGIGEIMTWDQLANFLIAIGMLVVGLKITNELGAMGGSVMSKAVDAGKKVAMMGSGISAGMWAGKGAIGLGKKAGIGVGKYAVSPITDRAQMLGKRAKGVWNETLGKKGLERKAQLAKMDENLATQEAGIATKGRLKRYEFFSGDTTKSLGDNIIKKEIAERKTKGEEEAYVGAQKIKITQDEEVKIKLKWEEKIAEARKKKMDGIVLAGDEQQILSDEAGEKINEAKALAEDDKKVWDDLKDEEKKKYIKGAEQQELEMSAASIADDEGAEMTADNKDEYIKKVRDKALNKYEASAIKLAGGENEWKGMTFSEKRSYKTEAEFRNKAKGNLELLNKAGFNMTEDEKKQKAITEAGDLQDSERGALYQEAIEESGVPLYSSYLSLGKAAQKVGKAGRWLEQSTATVDDMMRAKEGKMGDRLIKFEDAQYQSDIEKMDRLDYEEKVNIIKDTYNDISSLKTKAKTKDGLDDQERKLLKNGTQNMARALASMYKSGDSEFLNEILEDLDGDFKNIDLSKAENNHIRDMAFLSGASAGDLVDGEGKHKEEELQKLQEDTLITMREKEGSLMRGLMRAKNLDAAQNGNLQENHQLSVLKDVNGNKKVGFTNLAKSGKTGTDKVLVTGESRTGSQVRQGKLDYLMSTKKLSDIDGSSYISGKTKTVEIGGVEKQVAEDYALPGVSKKILTFFASANANSINSLTIKQINGITGGQAEYSSFDMNDKKFKVGSGAVLETMDGIFKNWHAQYPSANETGKQKIKETATAFLSRAGVDDPDLINKIIKDSVEGGNSLSAGGYVKNI